MNNKGIKINEIFDWEKVKDAIFFSVSQPTKNELEHKLRVEQDEPCRFENGMKVNYKVLINDEKGKISTGKVSNQMLKIFRTNEYFLYELAKENTPKLFEPREIDADESVTILDRAEYLLCPSVLKKYTNNMGGKVFAWTDNTKQLVILKDGFFENGGNDYEEKKKNLDDAFHFWSNINGTFDEYNLKDVEPIYCDSKSNEQMTIDSFHTFKRYDYDKRDLVDVFYINSQKFFYPTERDMLEALGNDHCDYKYLVDGYYDESHRFYGTLEEAQKEFKELKTELEIGEGKTTKQSKGLYASVKVYNLEQKFYDLDEYNEYNDTNLSKEEFRKMLVENLWDYNDYEKEEYLEELETTEIKIPVLVGCYHEWTDYSNGEVKSEFEEIGVLYFDNYSEAENWAYLTELAGTENEIKREPEDVRKAFYMCTNKLNSGFDKDDYYEVSVIIGDESFDADIYTVEEVDEIAEKECNKLKEEEFKIHLKKVMQSM